MDRQDILNTIELLEREGWGKGYYKTPDGYCIIGAYAMATGRLPSSALRDLQPLLTIIQEQFPDRHSNLIDNFNDDPETTYEDIIMVLEKTAAKLDEQNG